MTTNKRAAAAPRAAEGRRMTSEDRFIDVVVNNITSGMLDHYDGWYEDRVKLLAHFLDGWDDFEEFIFGRRSGFKVDLDDERRVELLFEKIAAIFWDRYRRNRREAARAAVVAWIEENLDDYKNGKECFEIGILESEYLGGRIYVEMTRHGDNNHCGDDINNYPPLKRALERVAEGDCISPHDEVVDWMTYEMLPALEDLSEIEYDEIEDCIQRSEYSGELPKKYFRGI